MNEFKSLPLLPTIQNTLEALNFTTLTEVQSKAIPLLLEQPQQDFHGQAQTGTGKTLAFGIPLLQAIDPSAKRVQGLIVAPTRELVLQIYESLRNVSRGTGIAIEAVYGGMSIDRQIASIKRGAQIIVGTPGRLNDHLRRNTLSLDNLATLVLDEADLMLDMGFREEVDKIMSYAPESRATWLFSATVRPSIKKLITSHMHNVVSVKAESKEGLVTTDVQQQYCIIPQAKRLDALVAFIESTHDFYGIVFCQTKVLTNDVMEQLVRRGFHANCLHGDMSQASRNQVIKRFKNKSFTILVATDVAARGIDVADLTHVVNFSLPDEHDAYVHRIGRTGRAGKEGTAISFVSPRQIRSVKQLEKSVSTKLHNVSVPSKETIIQSKMQAITDLMGQLQDSSDTHSSIQQKITSLVDTYDYDAIKRTSVALLEEKFLSGIDERVKEVTAEEPARTTGTAGSGRREVCINIGRDDGITENAVRDYLNKTCAVDRSEIDKVRVLNRKTFICVSDKQLDNCVKNMKKNPISQKSRIRIVRDEFDKKMSAKRA
jgi:ATP-dependent RNA helicase DeaD